jgi:hypothetical protein
MVKKTFLFMGKKIFPAWPWKEMLSSPCIKCFLHHAKNGVVTMQQLLHSPCRKYALHHARNVVFIVQKMFPSPC